jgi:hypothetical protein
MREGVLREMVLEIRQPTFMRREELQQMIAVPSWFAWNVLTFDLYEKHVVSSIGEGG